jgi:hypothetical protein
MRNRFRYVLSSALLIAALPCVARAQLKFGGFLGRQYDQSTDWLLFGGEVQIPAGTMPFTLAPRVTYQPSGDGSYTQMSLNVIHDFKVAAGEPMVPYLGLGVGIAHSSFGSESENKATLNYVAGIRFPINNSHLVPYLNSEYVAATQFSNRYMLTGGLSYSLK